MNPFDRIVDANLNRAAEGLRVIEDLARLQIESSRWSADLRNLRHDLRKSFADISQRLLISRDSEGDIGRQVSSASRQDAKSGTVSLVTANFKRVQEALRVIEEHLKAGERYAHGKLIENLRFETYRLEKEILPAFRPSVPAGIYGITAEKYSVGRSNVEVVKQMIAGGVAVVQYREKAHRKSLREIFRECRQIRQITADHGIPFIVNDFVDVAVMVGADGVHAGQDDLPLTAIRPLVGSMMIGISTHSPDQARRAVAEGADYIGVGPIFATHTKKDVCAPVGMDYLSFALSDIDIPKVAIGGIKTNTLKDVAAAGATTVCLVTEIVSAPDITQRVRLLNQILQRTWYANQVAR